MALYQPCAVEGDFDKRRRIISAMMPLMRLLEQGGKFVQCIKHGTTMAGIAAGGIGGMMPPLTALSNADQRNPKQVARVLKTTISGIKNEG